jgi:Undecaprenyl-phosphate glucose phosphotransferase
MNSTDISAGITAGITAGNWPGLSARRRPDRDAAVWASDLLPLSDFLGLLLVLSSALLLQSRGLAPPAWSEARLQFTPAGFGATLLAPFILYDQGFATRATRGRLAAWLPAFGPRFLILILFVALLASFSAPLAIFSPDEILACVLVALLVTLVPRLLLAGYMLRLQRRGGLKERVAVVGAGPLAERMVRAWRAQRPDTIEVLGVFDDCYGRAGPCGPALRGNLDQLIELARVQRVDWVLLALPTTARCQLRPLLLRLKALAVPIGLCPLDAGQVGPCRPIAWLADELPVSLLVDCPLRRRDVLAKGAVDLIFSAALIVLLLPVWALIAVAIRLDSPGPLIFRQRRHAVNGQEFDIFKFRTMSWNPAAPGQALQQTGRVDARVTRVGRYLRRSSLDELPQLFNVLRGDMSLVGPRPHAVNMRTEDRLGSEITGTYTHRQRVKPGMTGWAQVNGARGATDTTGQLRRRIELDLHYIENWSLLLDFRILMLTSRSVLQGGQAY